jgi:DNA polymerase III alpha subunit
LFHSARWKAYLQDIMKKQDEGTENESNILSIYHSEKLWFAQEEKNNHLKEAEEHLKRSNELMKDCTNQVDELEETLANTPKPSEMLNWDTITLKDLM